MKRLPAVALALAGAVAALAQEQKALPAFPSRAEVVTLDVVVVDKQGRPVRGLAAVDFAVFEEGRPQVVVAFEAIDRVPIAAGPMASGTTPDAGVVAQPAQDPRRGFVFVVDDLGLDPVSGVPVVKKAITDWLTTKAAPTDEVTILNTTGDLARTDRVARGRADLLAVLDRIRGRKPLEQATMSEAQAWAIAEGAPGSEALVGQLAQRAFRAGTCSGSRDCTSQVRMAAQQIHDRSDARVGAVLESILRASNALAPLPGRKSIVVLSEGFLLGSRSNQEAAIRASQRTSTAIYLVDARGLHADRSYAADTDEIPNSVKGLFSDTLPATEDGGYLAEATGGLALRNTNDITAGLGRILEESSAYYRIGYQPEKALDGRWRKLNVKVRRRKVDVRARRGYYASPTTTVAAAVPPAVEVSATDTAAAGQPAREAAANADLPSPPAAAQDAAPESFPDPVLATVLEKAGAYVEEYGLAFRDVVAEETYTQWNAGSSQQLRSDLLFVSIPGPIPWTCFRDAFEVNGLRVRDRESRVEKLFVSETRASAMEKADAVIMESARFNLGWGRTINIPTLPLLFLHPDNQRRFRFERKGSRRFGDRQGIEIAFLEIQQPTLVNDGKSGDVVASGRVFVDALEGIVLRTEVSFRAPRALAHLTADYRFDRGLGLWLPAEMQEGYQRPQGGVFDTEATARYAKYRHFGVATEEQVALPPQK